LIGRTTSGVVVPRRNRPSRERRVRGRYRDRGRGAVDFSMVAATSPDILLSQLVGQYRPLSADVDE
jgi:hypothetical protein